MSAPLTTRDALAAVLAQHESWGGGYYCTCSSPLDDDGRAEPLDPSTSWEQHLADALLASGALIDATKLAEDEALVERLGEAAYWEIPGHDPVPEDGMGAARAVLTALAAALSAQSERAEVGQ